MTSIGAALPGTATGASSVRALEDCRSLYGVLTLVALLLFVVLGRSGSSTFGLTGGNAVALPPLVLPARGTGDRLRS